MAVVQNTLSPVPVAREVLIRLVAPAGWRDDGDIEVLTGWSATVDDDGEWSADLPPQSAYVAEGTWYQVTEPRATHAIVVPDGAGPHQLYDLLVDPVPTGADWLVTPTMAQLRDATGLAGATDGQVPTWDAAEGEWIPGSGGGGGGGGVTDHGLLTGLGDNDHSQYQLTSGKGAASGYAGLDGSAKVPILQLPTGSTSSTVPLGDHTHDSRYYTETEVDSSLAGKASSTHAASHNGGSDPVTPAGIGAATAGHDHGATYQPLDADLTAIAVLAPADDTLIQRKAGAWTARTPVQVKADLALSSGDVGLDNVTNTAQVPVSVVDAKGDLLVGTAADTVARLPAGTTGQLLAVDSTEPSGIRWSNPVSSVYPLEGMGFHSASCDPVTPQVQSTFGTWHLRVWIPAGKPLATVGIVITSAGTLGAGGLNCYGLYSDDGATLIGQTPITNSLWTGTNLVVATLSATIAAEPVGRFIRVIPNVEGYSGSPSVAYVVPVHSAGATINGTGHLQRRSAFVSSPFTGAFPASIDPDTLGTATNFLPYVLIG